MAYGITYLCAHHGPGINAPFPQVHLVGDQNPRQGRRRRRQGRPHSLQPPAAALKGISVANVENHAHESCILVVGGALFFAREVRVNSTRIGPIAQTGCVMKIRQA